MQPLPEWFDEESAQASFRALRGVLRAVAVGPDQKIDLHATEPWEPVLCGDHGWQAPFRERCPKCAGPVVGIRDFIEAEHIPPSPTGDDER